jgi:TatD DNase family protein
MPLVDSHCHVQDTRFDEDREAVIEAALQRLDWLVVIGDDLPTSEAGMQLIRPGIYAAVGIHPYHAASVTGDAIDTLRAWAAEPGVVALGEMGLDYYIHNDTPRDVQQEGFRRQLELAAELSLPVVIHNRDAEDDTAAILGEFASKLPGGVLHCFGGPAWLVPRAVEWGFYVSFAGNVTFPKAGELRDAALATPLDRILVETDAPYLAPQPVRGKRCLPEHVAHTAACIADLHRVDRAEFESITAANAARLFRVSP